MDFDSTIIGAPVSQIGGQEKVTGQTRFAADVILPGMLWGNDFSENSHGGPESKGRHYYRKSQFGSNG